MTTTIRYKILFINNDLAGGFLVKAKRYTYDKTAPLCLITKSNAKRHKKWIDAMDELNRIEFTITREVAAMLRKGDVILVEKKL